MIQQQNQLQELKDVMAEFQNTNKINDFKDIIKQFNTLE